jgi:hypothetical protein
VQPRVSQAARRTILRELGVEVWRIRAAGTAPAAAPGEQVNVPTLLADERTPGEPETAAISSGTTRPARQGESSLVDDALAVRFAVESFAQGQVLLLVEDAAGKRLLRFAQDLLSAASGAWSATPARRRFEWPPAPDGLPGAPSLGAAAPARALRAFVARSVQDFGTRRVLCTPAVAERLAGWDGPPVLVIPPLEPLARDAAEKRRLWARLAGPPAGGDGPA